MLLACTFACTYMYMYIFDIHVCVYPSSGHRTVFVLTKVDMAEHSGMKQDRVSDNIEPHQSKSGDLFVHGHVRHAMYVFPYLVKQTQKASKLNTTNNSLKAIM